MLVIKKGKYIMKKMSIMCLIVLSISLLVCQQGAKAEDVMELTLQHYFSSESSINFLQVLIAEFEAQNPGVKIKSVGLPFAQLHNKLITQAMAKQVPDIAMVNNFDIPYIVEAGALKDMTELIDAWGKWDDFFPGSQQAVTMDGKIYAVHLGTNNLALFYNPDMFAEAGLTEPPKTWDDLLEYSAKLVQDDRYAIAFSATDDEQLPWQLKPFLWTNGGDMLTLDSPESAEALQLWVTLVEKGYASKDVVNWGQGDIDIQYKTGKAAMMIMGPWDIPGLLADNMPFKIASIPTPEIGMIPSVPMGGETFGISAFIDEERAQKAWEFIRFVIDEKQMLRLNYEFGYVPTRKSFIEPFLVEKPLYKPFVDQLPQARRSKAEQMLNYNEISTIARAAFQAALLGQASAEDALKEAAEEINAIVE
ncbi:MAG: ABC transporter substrate-binding protein [bacterium]|nr:ABC transporter substrate-binding protein [bacterium]